MYEETEREAKHREAREKAFAEGQHARRIGWARDPHGYLQRHFRNRTVTYLQAHDAWLWGWDTEDHVQRKESQHAVA